MHASSTELTAAGQLAVYYFERALAVTGRHRAFSTDDPRMAPVKPFTDEIREAYAYNQIGLAYKARRHPHPPRTADIQAIYLLRHRAALTAWPRHVWPCVWRAAGGCRAWAW